MRLKYIKLVGFKSFVDPTKVPFPHQMTCVVGPNGCGKSNVIDAVRWVLGESSAKNLRGDAMTDVIFNGSTARKPVSQASVELVFDNSEGRLQGEYASYAEISVKRVVTRDAQSTYLLNGSKCRRRDITDIFLGTGLGPRSYAIIEQGMISRLIESKPQELRVFIEEAAGISKYKERRKETESRMQHTRDNLERLSDVREELGKQLDKLQRQAQAARRYKALKADERKYKAELQALRWLHNDSSATQLRERLQQEETELERWISEQRGSERGTDELRAREQELKESAERVQQSYYQLGAEITKLEQQLQHQRQLQAQREQRERQLRDELEQLQHHQSEEQEQQELLAAELAELQPQQEAATETLTLTEAQAEAAEQRWQQWQDDYQERLRQQQQHEQQLQRLQLARENLAQQQQQVQQQLQQLQSQQQELEQQQQQQHHELAQLDSDAAASALALAQAEVDQQEQHREQAQVQYNNWQSEQDALQQQRQQLRGQISSVERLLAAQQQQWPQELQQWLQQHQYQSLGTVSELLQGADASWRAFEHVLQHWLQAPVLIALPASLPRVFGARLAVLDTETQAPAGSLAEALTGPLQQWPYLQGIGLVATAAEAQQLLNQSQWWSVVANDGTWLTRSSYQAPSIADEDSALQQQQELQQLQTQLQQCESQLQELDVKLSELQNEQDQRRQNLQQLQSKLREQHEHWVTVREREQYMQQRLAELSKRLEQGAETQQNLLLEQEVLAEKDVQLEEQLDQLQATGHEDENPAAMQAEREQLQQNYQQFRQQLQQARSEAQQLTLQCQQLQSQLQQAAQLKQRTQTQLQQLQEQLQAVLQPDTDVRDEQELLQVQLEEALARHQEVAEQRAQVNNQVSDIEAELRGLQQGQQGVEQKIERSRRAAEALKLELSALDERSRNILQGLSEMNQSLKPVLEQLPEDADEKRWQQEVDRLQSAIGRLGAINLAAIEEADAQAERKQYLDQQHDDLQASLETLETAIRKIDKETRQRFKTTFDAVNSDLQALFPKVFGGGSAYLELTDDDLLDTGVTIMARPPGKKNSTIHLLSGGEKALTALSLVFAIFRLNPAPFCLLDEVDAPLDDANVGRFCRLVEEMSATVQFIYISHNKVAMEMASHLAGVTMQEAGVSRLVAVDVEEAVAMAHA